MRFFSCTDVAVEFICVPCRSTPDVGILFLMYLFFTSFDDLTAVLKEFQGSWDAEQLRTVWKCVVAKSAGSGSLGLRPLLVETALTSKETCFFRQIVSTCNDDTYCLTWKDVKGSDCGRIWGSAPEFVWEKCSYMPSEILRSAHTGICMFCTDLRTNSDYFPIQH